MDHKCTQRKYVKISAVYDESVDLKEFMEGGSYIFIREMGRSAEGDKKDV